MKFARYLIVTVAALGLLQSCCLPLHDHGGGRGRHHYSSTQSPDFA